jgi:hypothetical protein
MNNKPVTYLKKDESTGLYYECDKEYGFAVYTHPHPDNLRLAESIIKQQQAEIESLKQVLGRYVKEVPLGNQPHMLAHIALELVNG